MRAAGRWAALWAEMQASCAYDEIIALTADMTPEEESASDLDQARALAVFRSDPECADWFDERGRYSVQSTLARIEQTEGPGVRRWVEERLAHSGQPDSRVLD